MDRFRELHSLMALKTYGKLDFNGYVTDLVGVKEEHAPTPEAGKLFLQQT